MGFRGNKRNNNPSAKLEKMIDKLMSAVEKLSEDRAII
jgi:hypothetical protein